MWLVVHDIVNGHQLPDEVEVPGEWQDFMLLREMGWSWRDLTGQKRVPHYVAESFKHFLALVNAKR